MKGIILAGGSGTRLHPITTATNKHLLPIFDKPMIYYPISTLMLAGIRELILISTPRDLPRFEELLGDGSSFGLDITYLEQPEPRGIGEAFSIAKNYIIDSKVALILGDNIFYGSTLGGQLARFAETDKATIFTYHVADASRYGVAEVDEYGEVLNLKEKPIKPKSNLAITGLYFFPENVLEYSSDIELGNRGEYEIISILEKYRMQGQLQIHKLPRGTAWLDTGTHEGLVEATNFVRTLEDRQGLKIACLEEIAFTLGFIDKNVYIKNIERFGSNAYGNYLRKFLELH